MAEDKREFAGPGSLAVANDGVSVKVHAVFRNFGWRAPSAPAIDYEDLSRQVEARLAGSAPYTRFCDLRERLNETLQIIDAVERDLTRADLARRDALADLVGEELAVALSKASQEAANLVKRKEILQDAIKIIRPEFEQAKAVAARHLEDRAAEVRSTFKGPIRDEQAVLVDLVDQIAPVLSELVASRSPTHYLPDLSRLAAQVKATLLTDKEPAPSVPAEPASATPATIHERGPAAGDETQLAGADVGA
jgi:hypothetical protein